MRLIIIIIIIHPRQRSGRAYNKSELSHVLGFVEDAKELVAEQNKPRGERCSPIIQTRFDANLTSEDGMVGRGKNEDKWQQIHVRIHTAGIIAGAD